MRVVSWNVQSLGGSQCAKYRGRLRQELQRCLVGGNTDVFLIQEHHLSKHRIKRYGFVLRGKRVVVVPGRAQYITMQYHDEVIGILNVYAPNQASARADFWALLASALPRVDSWCIGRDFNMLESPEDRIGGSHVTVQGSELAAWEQLCMSLRISDSWLLEDFSGCRVAWVFLVRTGGGAVPTLPGWTASMSAMAFVLEGGQWASWLAPRSRTTPLWSWFLRSRGGLQASSYVSQSWS